jgi:tetratricopeptide (TPR) repeat protein
LIRTRPVIVVPALAIGMLASAFAQTPEQNERLCSGDAAQAAVAACTAIIQSDQEDPDQALPADVASAFNRRGHAYFALGDPTRAIADFDRAITLDPKSIQAYYNRGIAYFSIRQPDRAIADLDQAIKLDPTNTYAFTNRGVVHAEAGRYALALRDFDQAIGLDPTNANALYDRGLVKRMNGDATGGEADIARARQIDPSVGR